MRGDMDGLAAFASYTLGPALTVEFTLLLGFVLLLNMKSILQASIWQLIGKSRNRAGAEEE